MVTEKAPVGEQNVTTQPKMRRYDKKYQEKDYEHAPVMILAYYFLSQIKGYKILFILLRPLGALRPCDSRRSLNLMK